VLAHLAPRFRSQPLAHWLERLRLHEVPHSPLQSPPDILASEQGQHLGLAVSTTHPVMGPYTTIRSPLSFDGQRATSVVAPPVLGEHDGEILGRH
jgi:crotonobetainyl-CoA:carnitine CoA-transferase CaiB-like acyl-CoA transferase